MDRHRVFQRAATERQVFSASEFVVVFEAPLIPIDMPLPFGYNGFRTYVRRPQPVEIVHG